MCHMCGSRRHALGQRPRRQACDPLRWPQRRFFARPACLRGSSPPYCLNPRLRLGREGPGSPSQRCVRAHAPPAPRTGAPASRGVAPAAPSVARPRPRPAPPCPLSRMWCRQLHDRARRALGRGAAARAGTHHGQHEQAWSGSCPRGPRGAPAPSPPAAARATLLRRPAFADAPHTAAPRPPCLQRRRARARAAPPPPPPLPPTTPVTHSTATTAAATQHQHQHNAAATNATEMEDYRDSEDEEEGYFARLEKQRSLR